MKKSDTHGDARNDNWALLLGDLGIDEPLAERQADTRKELEETVAAKPEMPGTATEVVKKVRETSATETPFDSFGAGLLDDVPVQNKDKSDSGQSAKREEPVEAVSGEENSSKGEKSQAGKKRFFDRFPKMNLFGSAPKESLESVVEAAKSPSLSGKSFTSNKLEKVPVATERSSRKKNEDRAAKPAPDAEVPKQDELNPWASIASQVGVLSTPESPNRAETKPSRKDGIQDDRPQHRRRGRRQLPSMFDEAGTESEESANLKELMAGGKRGSDQDAEERLFSMFGSKPGVDAVESRETANRKDDRRRGERPARGRRNRVDEAPSPESVEEDPFAAFHAAPSEARQEPHRASRRESPREERQEPRERREQPSKPEIRGRRGSRYVDRESLESGVDSSYLQERDFGVHDEPRHSSRGSASHSVSRPERSERDEMEVPRSRSRGRRAESDRSHRADFALEPTGLERETSEHGDHAQVHKSVPSWDDTISALVDANIARRSQRTQRNGGRR